MDVITSHDPSKPLFLYLAENAVHSALAHQPLQAPQNLINKFNDSIQDEKRRIFAAMATALDESVGKVNQSDHFHAMVVDNANCLFLHYLTALCRIDISFPRWIESEAFLKSMKVKYSDKEPH